MVELKLIIRFLPEEVKYVSQKPAYPMWSLGAEIGGYLGMFLGYSLLQVPQLAMSLMQRMKKAKKILSKS